MASASSAPSSSCCFASRPNSSPSALLAHAHAHAHPLIPPSVPAGPKLTAKKSRSINPTFSSLGRGFLPVSASAASDQDAASATTTTAAATTTTTSTDDATNPSSSKTKAAVVADAPAPKPAAKAAPAKPAVPKAVNKTLPEIMNEDVIPKLKGTLEKEEDISDVNILFRENQLEGSFVKNEVTYAFWAFFPDGKLEGSRGFSLSSHGAPPSTVEPFLIDEKKINADLVIFWITKRLFAQKFLSRN